MKRLSHLTCAIALACFLTTGCTTSTNTAKAPAGVTSGDQDKDGHKHPETLQEALTELSEVYTTVKTAFESNKVDDAHGPLHDVGHLLGDMEKMVEKSELDADAKSKVEAGVKSLIDSFGKIDDMFHGGPKVEFAELDKSIAPAMEELKGLIK
jgi:hypothetical protein